MARGKRERGEQNEKRRGMKDPKEVEQYGIQGAEKDKGREGEKKLKLERYWGARRVKGEISDEGEERDADLPYSIDLCWPASNLK